LTWVLLHLPHLLPPALAFVFLARVGVWAADQPPQQFEDEEADLWRAERAARKAAKRRPVRRGVATAGVLALTPLILAIVTGLIIYTFNLRNDRPSPTLIWIHTGFSVVGLALTTWKAGLLGARRLRRELTLRRPQDGLSSLLLLALGVPLLATGVWLLRAPSGNSFADYLHLIVSVWWTLILQWHLWRYLGRALAATFHGTGTTAGRPTPPPAAGEPPRSAPVGL
jgi:hypothetical protein